MRRIAVFDTNILFSGVGWKGKLFLCLELSRARRGPWRDLPRVARRVGREAPIEALLYSGAQTLDLVAYPAHFYSVLFLSPVSSRPSPRTQSTICTGLGVR